MGKCLSVRNSQGRNTEGRSSTSTAIQPLTETPPDLSSSNSILNDAETGSTSLSIPVSPKSHPHYTVFISHAGEDKATIAIPLRRQLKEKGITAFVDEADMSAGTDAKQAMMNALRTSNIAVIVLSPEFIAKKWPMTELMHFLVRREQSLASDCQPPPVIIPFFYRLKVHELYDEPRLDRTDGQGRLLYKTSRFYERQKNGEQEANIAAIKKALETLHGIMGFRNFIDANNDPSLDMAARREVILEKLVNEICRCVCRRTVKTIDAIPGTGSEGDVFKPHFDIPYDVSDLVFDFHGKDNSGNICTQEGKVLELVLEESRIEKRAIVVRGIGGVGKTCLLRGIRNLQVVREQFQDGIYKFSLGMDATRVTLIEALSTAVSMSGGKKAADLIRVETDLREIMESFGAWFANKRCLFLVDDVWETAEISAGTIYSLLRLHLSGRDSKVLLTTRSLEVAARAGTYFPLEPRGLLEEESQAILFRYSGLKPGEGDKIAEEAVREILRICGGLPLFLAVAGRAVKALSFRNRNIGCLTYHAYAEKLEKNMNSLVTTEFDTYEGLAARLRVSIALLEERRAMFGFETTLSVGEMHKRLSVMTKQARVPMTMLMHLWELDDEMQAAIIAKEFEQIGLADVEFHIRGSYAQEVLSLHDSVYEFAVYETRISGDQRLGHQTLLERYGSSLASRAGIWEWWSTILDPDDYIHRNVCWHLMEACRKEELFQLLLTPQWAERQMALNGILALESDFSLGVKKILHEIAPEDKEDPGVREEALGLIAQSVRLSAGFVLRNKREFCFQIHGRLIEAQKGNTLIQRYLEWIEKKAQRPQLISVNRILVEPGGTNMRIISVRKGITCMVWLQYGVRVACGCQDGRIAVVNVLRSEIERWWKAHENIVCSITADRAATRLVSVSTDPTVKVWSVETIDCLATFKADSDTVRRINTTSDGQRVVISTPYGIQTWDINTGQPLGSPIRMKVVECMAMFRDGERMMIGGEDGMLRVWNTRTEAQEGAPFEGHSGNVMSVVITADGRTVVSGSWDGTVRRWDVESHRQIGEPLRGHLHWVSCVALSMDERRIVSGSFDKTIRIWDMDSGREVCGPLRGHSHGIVDVSFLEDTDSIISGSYDGTIRVWDVRVRRDSKDETVSNRHESQVLGVSFTPDGRFVVSASRDRTLRIWNARSGQQIGKPLIGHGAPVSDVTVTPDGRHIISVSLDRTVRIWDFKTHKQIRIIASPVSILYLGKPPRNGFVVAGCQDRTIRIWDVGETDDGHIVLNGHPANLSRVFLSDDQPRIISVDYANNIFVWDVKANSIVKSVMKDGARGTSRREIFDAVEEVTVYDDAGLSIPLPDREITYGHAPERIVLATLESNIRCWELSPDKTTLCVGLANGVVGLAKLQI